MSYQCRLLTESTLGNELADQTAVRKVGPAHRLRKTNIVAVAEFDDPEADCAQAILDYLEASGHGHDKAAPLFKAVKSGQNSGHALSRASFYNLFKKYVKLAGLPETITPHSARATFITHAFENGVKGVEIQRTVGHSSITTTESYNQSAKKLRNSASLGMRY